MKNNLVNAAIAGMICMLAFSCSKEVSDYEETVGTSSLKVMTKAAAASSGMTVASPVNVYVFDASAKCVGYKKVDDSKDNADFKLNDGTYSVYAVAGAGSESYDLPQQSEATPQSVVALKSDKSNGDLMCAAQNVVLKDGEDSEATLQMQRKVLLLTEIIVADVPDEVTAIKATIAPLYENLRIDGEYSGESGAEQFTLSKQGSTATWRSDCNCFLLPSVGNATVKFVFTTNDGKTKTFTYSSAKPLVANYKVAINVNYIKIKNPTLKCVINGVEWDGTDSWEIDADERTFTSDTGGEEPDTDDEGTAPKAGTVYKGCYVLKTENSGSVIKAILVSPDSKSKLTFANGDNSSVAEAVDKAIGELAVDGITGWRLPTLEEVKYIKEHASEINKSLPSGIQNFPSSASYYYKDKNSVIRVYYSASDTTGEPATGKATMVRPLATVNFSK